MQYLNDKGHLTDEALALYAEALKLNKLGQAPKALKEHLEQCPSCQEQAMALYALIADQDYSGLGAHPTFDQRRDTATASSLKMWFRPLLLLLMAVMALFFYWQQQKEQLPAMEKSAPAILPPVDADSLDTRPPLSPPQANSEAGSGKRESRTDKAEGSSKEKIARTEENPKSKISNQKSQIKNQKFPSSVIAANFTPSETLDPLAGTITRGQVLSEIKPLSGAKLEIGQAVVFSWQTTVQQPLALRLLNNREEEVFSHSVEGNRLVSPMTLQPGLYYWKLETEDDLLYIGKFYVGKAQ